MYKRIIQILLISLFFIVVPFTIFAENDKPNVILIMTDDQGYGDLSCHGNSIIETPSLNKLHSESVCFTNFHVNPFCAPTRAALMTGRHSDLTHVRTTINGRNHLNSTETTMAEYFKVSGYVTGHFGKWHLGHNYPYRPIDRGFDQWVGHGDGGTGTSSDYWGNDKMNDTYKRNGHWEKFEGFGTDIYFNETMKFVEKNSDNPFFVYLATNVPHGPWNVKLEWREKYRQKFENFTGNNQESVIDFFTTITKFDENLGRLRTFLAEKGLAENTIIIYLTDNGTSGGNTIFNAGMRGKKGAVYEGGHRVPCFIHLPSQKITSSQNIDLFTAHIDLLPTLIDLCKLKAPEKAKHKLSGRSLKNLINGQEHDWKDRVFVLHSQNITQQHTKWKNSMVATENWRLVNQNELYDIKADPGQKKNIASNNPEIVSKLKQEYEKYWKEINEGKSPYARPVLGSGKIKETWLTCDGWIPEKDAPNTWNQSHVNSAIKNFGFWPVKIAKEGEYHFEVRRWPKEVNCSINSVPKAQTNEDIYRNNKPVLVWQGKIIYATKVKLKIGIKTLKKL